MATMSSNRESFTSKPVDSSQAPAGYESQWMNNPYATFDYHHTWWQKLLEGFGFRTDFNKYQESMNMNAKEYEAQLLEKAHNEEYDSAAAQAARMRQAGINPDLQGGVDAGSSSGIEPDPSMPAPPGDDRGVFSGFANVILSCFTGAVGLAKDFLSLGIMTNDVDSGRISNSAGIVDFALNAARNFIPEQYPEGDPEWVNRAVDQAYDSSSLFMSKKQQRMFRRALTSFYQSAPTQAEQWKFWRENMSNKQGWFVESGSKFWQDGTDEVLRVVTNNLSKAYDRIKEKSLSVEGKSLSNQEEYLNTLDPSLQAQVENTTNQRNVHSADIDAILNECLDSIVRDLRDTSESGKRGHGLAQAALLLFSLLRMVNFSSTSTKGVTPFGAVDTTQSRLGF